MAKGQQLKHFYPSRAKEKDPCDINESPPPPPPPPTLQHISDNSYQYVLPFTLKESKM